jgi:hypothetical protein
MSRTIEISRELAELVVSFRLDHSNVAEIRALLDAPVIERKPDAYLVTDIHGQKKALRAGAEGIERHRNSGSTLVPLFATQSSKPQTIDDWYTDECGNLRYKPEEDMAKEVNQ